MASEVTVCDETESGELQIAQRPAHAHDKAIHTVDLVLYFVLAALWGGSFLFMRATVAEFGPIPLITMRLGLASVVLLGIVAVQGQFRTVVQYAWPCLIVGIVNTALPFCLLANATKHLTAGFTSILNATTPFSTAIIGYLWLRQRMSRMKVLGLVVGFSGVVVLLWNRASFNGDGVTWSIVSAFAATICYGVGTNYAMLRLSKVHHLPITAGSMVGGTLFLTPFAVWNWPSVAPSWRAWGLVSVFAFFCTAIAYIIFYRLISRIGGARAITVTFLTPAFAILWGAIFMSETLTLNMTLGACIILLGTSLTTGLIKLPQPKEDHLAKDKNS